MVVVKILIDGKEYGVDVSEDMGEVTIHDTFHCDAKVDGSDTIFGTKDPMITVKIKEDDDMINQAREIIRKYLNIEIIGYTNDPKNNIITFDLYDFLDKPGNFESDIKSAVNEIQKLLPNHTVETKFYNDNYWNGEKMEDTYNCILGIIGGDL